MEQIVINDTNVFIDLYSVGLLEEFFSLPWEIYTTELVMLELLREGQNKAVDHYRDIGRLHIPTLYAKDMHTIVEMHIHFQGKTNVSVADCSVWYYAKQNNYIILTGDRKLRKASVLDGVEVHGILYVFDKLVETRIISPADAIQKLTLLHRINPRLPNDAIEERLNKWREQISSQSL